MAPKPDQLVRIEGLVPAKYAAAILGMKVRSFYNLLRREPSPFPRYGGHRVMVKLSEVHAYIESTKRGGPVAQSEDGK